MKKILSILVVMLSCMAGRAQNITLNDLTNLVHLNNAEAYNYLIQARQFKREFVQDVDGHRIENYRSKLDTGKLERVVIGNAVRSYNGMVLRSVFYSTNSRQYLLNLVAQAKQAGLKKNLTGMDDKNNIYMFDNDLFSVTIHVGRGKSTGSVTVREKDVTLTN